MVKKNRREEEEEEGEDELSPELSPVDSGDDEDDDDSDDSYDDDSEAAGDEDDDDDDGDNEEEEEFEDQGSSDEDEDLLEKQHGSDDEDDDDNDIAVSYENVPRSWHKTAQKRKTRQQDKVVGAASAAATVKSTTTRASGKDDAGAAAEQKTAQWMHTDDLSSDDDDDGKGNRIGRVPLHWYDDYDHIGYDVQGQKVGKSVSASAGGGGDRIDQAIADQDNAARGKFVVYDALNDRNVELTERQLELIRRVQAGAYAHREHDGNPDAVDYFSGVDRQISGLRSDQCQPKARFQPSQWEKLQVDRLLDKLERGKINMDYLTGKIRDMNDANKPPSSMTDPDQPHYLLWQGDEEDLLNARKGPQHIAAPKQPPPGHAHSYRPPDEYLPTEDEKKQWAELPAKDRPHGLLVPTKHPNLRSVGAYQHSVRETFERCLDLYLCPRILKRRLNIDPESLVPRLPRAGDLKPFPTAKCIEYHTPHEEGETAPMIRSVAVSPDGQFMASGATDGVVRLWEVQTGRLLRSWDLAGLVDDGEEPKPKNDEDDDDEATPKTTKKPVVALGWNPNRGHHCLLAAIGKCVVIIATGTAGQRDAELTEALLASAAQGGNVTSNTKAANAVQWKKSGQVQEKKQPKHTRTVGPVCVLTMKREVAFLRWQSKGDYFVTVSPKAGAAAVLIHQLSKGNSQQPFSKAKGEPQLACFHPNKPFLFVASQQHIRVYHLVKQNMVKRLVSGCRWISSIDVHTSGDHLIVGSLDRRMIWFDLDLGTTPFKTLKYHERAVRSVRYHGRYPLMASASDDGAVHVFHSRVFNDLMRNPLIVPVKILRGHAVSNKLGVLTLAFHPTQPWLFTGGADGRIFLYQDI